MPASAPVLDTAPAGPRAALLRQLADGWHAYRQHSMGLVGLALVVLLLVVAVFAPWIAGYDPNVQDLQQRLLEPSARHWFGTDHLGRDVFARVVFGARTTVEIVLLVTVLVAPLGLVIGTTAGYAGGLVDEVLMRITDIFLAFPGLVLALGFAAALGPGLGNATIAIALTAWPPIARLSRAETLSLRQADFIAAVRLQGATPGRIVLRHILPLCIPSVIVRVTLNMAGVILTAAGLGFLGLGAQPPLAEWGAMVSSGRQFMIDSPWVVAAPGLAIAAITLAFNLAGDALRDVLDPRGDR